MSHEFHRPMICVDNFWSKAKSVRTKAQAGPRITMPNNTQQTTKNMRASSPLREIRGLKSLRRNRSGTTYSYSRILPDYPRNPQANNTPHRRSTPTGSSSSSSGTNSGGSSRNRPEQYDQRSLGMNVKLSQGRRTNDDSHEGVESMHHSLARGVVSAARRGRTKNDHCPFRNPLFQKRYARLIQDEENSIDPADEYEGILGLFVAKHILRKIMKCLTILFLTVCFTVFLSMNGDLYSIFNRNIPQHDAKYQSQMNINHTLVQINDRINLLDSFSNLTTSYDEMKETPFFLDIKLTGSIIVKRTISKCFQLSMACELGLRQPNYKEEELALFSSVHQGYTGLYVNVDVSTKKGIQRAKNLNLTQSHLADVISMDMLYEGNNLFKMKRSDNVGSIDYAKIGANTEASYESKGRLFTVFAHPISRAVAYYHYIKEATWDEDYNERINEMTLLEFASSKYVENNPMVRMLTNIDSDPRSPSSAYESNSTEVDLEVAKRILESKVLIGLYRDLDGSLARFQRYFGWDPNKNIKIEEQLTSVAVQTCKSELVENGDRWITMQAGKIVEGDEVWKKLSNSLHFDLELYKHAEFLYEVQGEKIFDVVN